MKEPVSVVVIVSVGVGLLVGGLFASVGSVPLAISSASSITLNSVKLSPEGVASNASKGREGV